METGLYEEQTDVFASSNILVVSIRFIRRLLAPIGCRRNIISCDGAKPKKRIARMTL